MALATSDLGLPERGLIARPRLVARLATRFERRVTLVVAGGGAGKTTVLTEAIRAETQHLDAPHACTPADRDDARLGADLLAACAAATGSEVGDDRDPVAAITELVLAASPRHVCLVVDDAHLLERYDVIESLLTHLPANGHVLLSARRRPALDTARLDAAGQLAELTQDDLLMTEQEQIEFANARGVDVGLLDGAEGWPAFVELAASGSELRSRRYLEEEALRAIAPDHRSSLAAFAFVRGGDDEVARAVTGEALDELVADLPLVRWTGRRAQLHDLWADLLVDELDEGVRRRAALAAAAVHRRRGDFDRAIDLAAQVEAWDDAAESLAAAVRDGVDGGLRSERLLRWRRVVPDHVAATMPTVRLIDGLIARERDPTSEEAWHLLDEAALVFERDGRRELALVALLQLGYVSRIRGEVESLAPVMERLERLADDYPPARSFLAFGEAWRALAVGRPDLQLAALERLRDDELPTVWRVTRDHLIAHALWNLGRPHDALERVPKEIETLPMPIPGALVTESQCLWGAGRPDEALRRRPEGMSDRHGARDRFIAGAWTALMHAYAGHVSEAREAMRVALDNVGAQPSILLSAQAIGVNMLVKIAEGAEAEAASDMAAILELAPLGQGVSEQTLRNHLPIPYVLAPSSRAYWDTADLAGSLRTLRTVAAAFVAAREEGSTRALASLDWPEPGVVAAALPVPWAVEFALRGLAAGRQEGRRLTAWLCACWGEPARAALRGWVDHDELGAVAREVLAHTPSPPPQRVAVEVLGPTNVRIDGYPSDDPDLRRERVRALLASLVLRPVTTREQLAGTLWPDHSGDRAAKNLRTTLGYLHGLLEPRRTPGDATWFVRVDGHRIELAGELDVDLWRFTDLLDRADRAEREGKPNTALPLLVEATSLWGGDLAADLDLEWLELERIHLRSRYVRGACRAAELLVAVRQPERAIEVVRAALEVDPWHERSYLALVEAYEAMGDRTSARAVAERAAATLGAPLGSEGRGPGW